MSGTDGALGVGRPVVASTVTWPVNKVTPWAVWYSRIASRDSEEAWRAAVTAKVTFGPKPEGGNAVLSSALTVRAQAPGGDATKLTAVAEDAKENCPISKALKGNVALSVEATPS